MSSKQQQGLSSHRIRDSSELSVDHLNCSICQKLLWKPVACQSCETPFCSACIYQWLINNPEKCPNCDENYIERECPPFVTKLLAQLQIACFYESNGCKQIIPYERLDKHETECGFQYQQCPGCQSQILKKDFDNHTSSCASIELTCQDCKLIYKRGEAAKKHTEKICVKEQLRQLRDECKENKREVHELTLQLDEIRILKPSITTIRITFNDLPKSVDQLKNIPKKYSGVRWSRIAYMHKSYAMLKYPKSAYATSFIPDGSSYIAYFQDNASISAENSNEQFTLFSVTACAASNDDQQLTIIGYRNNEEINTHTTTLLFGKPQFILLHWKDIDNIIFNSFGGTAHPDCSASPGCQVILAQLTISQID
ncbi:unnamed protein product [Rotaria sordida]|uniref:RING-type domain-containing protein n=1 Tax=Rotaria sordida TaxID=392033 RepID=A0A815IZG3_9BILA|nr:unnamed protein product [Rotaria sordida]CAF3994070.1 unnamed protein product [Rotaria sordida]